MRFLTIAIFSANWMKKCKEIDQKLVRNISSRSSCTQYAQFSNPAHSYSPPARTDLHLWRLSALLRENISQNTDAGIINTCFYVIPCGWKEFTSTRQKKNLGTGALKWTLLRIIVAIMAKCSINEWTNENFGLRYTICHGYI